MPVGFVFNLMLNFVRCFYAGLNYAISKRDVKTLERAIFVTKQQNFQDELTALLQTSESLLKDLKKLEVHF